MEEDNSNEEGGAEGDGTDCTQCIAEVLRGQCSVVNFATGFIQRETAIRESSGFECGQGSWWLHGWSAAHQFYNNGVGTWNCWL